MQSINLVRSLFLTNNYQFIFMETLKEIAIKYFYFFSNKNIYELEKMFTPEIELRDWNFHASGLKEVIKINKKIFTNCPKLLVNPINLWESTNAKEQIIFADLEIDTGSKEKDVVLDLLFFKNNKINKIIAYKGN